MALSDLDLLKGCSNKSDTVMVKYSLVENSGQAVRIQLVDGLLADLLQFTRCETSFACAVEEISRRRFSQIY